MPPKEDESAFASAVIETFKRRIKFSATRACQERNKENEAAAALQQMEKDAIKGR